MAIDVDDLHDLVYDALLEYSQGEYKNEMNTPRHMEIMADTMKDYFEDNLEILYGWSATNPASGATDPTTSFTSTVKFGSFDLSSPMDLPGLASKIMAAFATGVITHPSDFTVAPGAFAILPLVFPLSSDIKSALKDSIIAPICSWAKTLISNVPLSGSHAAFTGAATMSKIS